MFSPKTWTRAGGSPRTQGGVYLSWGTWPPASWTKVGKTSIRLVGSWITWPAGRTPGHRNIPGTRIPPSQPAMPLPPGRERHHCLLRRCSSLETHPMDLCVSVPVCALSRSVVSDSWPPHRYSPRALVVKHPPTNAGDVRDSGLIPGLGRYPVGGQGDPLQYPCLEHPMDRGVCRATVCGVAKSQTRLTGHAHMDCSPQASSGRGILQARILEWAAISFSRIIQLDHIKFYFIHFIKKNFFRHAERHVGS